MSESVSVNRKEQIGKFLDKYGILIILIFMVIGFTIAKPTFFSKVVFINIFKQVSVIGTLAFGSALVMITGGIDLSPGSVVALVGVVTATFAAPGNSIVVAILVGLVVGIIAGAINGSIIAITKIPPFIATLGMMTAARGFSFIFTDGKPVSNIADVFLQIGYGRLNLGFIKLPYIVIVFLLMGLVSHILLGKTTFGKKIYAIGGNEQAARVCGINVKKVLIIVYGYAGLMSAVGAVLLTARVASGNPTAALSYELDAIASAVIGGISQDGGVGNIPGVIVGALIMGTLNSGLTQMGVDPNFQLVFKAIIIVGAVVLDKYRHSRG